MSAESKNGKRICEALRKDGVLSQDQYASLLEHVAQTGERHEDAIVDLGLLPEADLLKALASFYKTFFVSTEKLAKADVSPSTLALVPRRFAETKSIFPVMFDAKNLKLSVVMAEPDDADVIREIQMSSGAREVKAFVARPAAIRAVILKCYAGDIHAFALLDRAAHAQFHAMLDVYQRNVVTDESMVTSLAKEASGRSRERVISEQQLARGATNAAAPSVSGAGGNVLELLNVLVSLLENTRQDLRGHSAHVARLMRRVGERMSLDATSLDAIVAAAYVHDLSKMGQYHLTALNVSEYDGHKIAAQKSASTPARLLESVRLSDDTLDAVTHMYERYDGKGFPEGLSGKDIPLGARLLAIVDTYADLTQNPRNPYRKQLSEKEACDALLKHRELVFDPNLLDLFRHAALGEDLKARLLANRYTALIVDLDPEETTLVELRLIEQGFVVKTARTSDQALKTLSAGDIDLVVSELDLGATDGLKLLADARAQTWGKEVPWVVYTRRQGRAEAQKAFELGVLDFVAKPASTDVLVAKLKALLDQRAAPRASRGVGGSLKEISVPDMIQVLSTGKKTGNLKIRSGNDSGEIHLIDGNVVNALWGQVRGQEAFFAMLKLADGQFGLDTQYKPTSRVISDSTDSLLLEGMRRIDEGLVK